MSDYHPASARLRGQGFLAALAISYGLAISCLLIWLHAYGLFGTTSGLGGIGFWVAHVGWLGSVIVALMAFGRRGAWTLLGLPALLPGPALLGGLVWACGLNGACP